MSSLIFVIEATACCHWSNTCESCWTGAKNWSRYRRNAMTVPAAMVPSCTSALPSPSTIASPHVARNRMNGK